MDTTPTTPQPMSDERLGFLRRIVELAPGARCDLPVAEASELLVEVDRLRAAPDSAHAAEAVAWVDSAGDVWIFPGNGSIGYSHETAPATRAKVEHKWGPLVPLVRATTRPAPTVLDFGTTTDAELALSQGLLHNPDNGELR